MLSQTSKNIENGICHQFHAWVKLMFLFPSTPKQRMYITASTTFAMFVFNNFTHRCPLVDVLLNNHTKANNTCKCEEQ